MSLFDALNKHLKPTFEVGTFFVWEGSVFFICGKQNTQYLIELVDKGENRRVHICNCESSNGFAWYINEGTHESIDIVKKDGTEIRKTIKEIKADNTKTYPHSLPAFKIGEKAMRGRAGKKTIVIVKYNPADDSFYYGDGVESTFGSHNDRFNYGRNEYKESEYSKIEEPKPEAPAAVTPMRVISPMAVTPISHRETPDHGAGAGYRRDAISGLGRYEMTENGHNKFWSIRQLPSGNYEATWGRIGTAGQSIIYSAVEAAKKIREKIAKGYVFVE
jgi:hypothetical protein